MLPALLAFGSLALYTLTAIRTPGWLDDTLILDLARRGEVGTWVNTHNLFNLLGHAWIGALGFLDPHAALTLFCGVLGSVTVLFSYHAGRELTGRPAAGALAAAALAVSHSLWWHATVVEVYALNTAIMTPVVYLVLRWFRTRRLGSLLGAYLLFGIGVFNHVLMGLFAPAYLALFVMLLARPWRLGWRAALALVAATVAGCLPYLVLFGRSVIALGGLGAALDGATGSFFRQSMFPRGLAAGERQFWRLNYLLLLWYNYPSAALPLAAWGAFRLFRRDVPRPFAVFFSLAVLAQAIWSSNYLIWDMYAFSLPVYTLASIPLAAGIDGLLDRGRPWLRRTAAASLLLPVALYPVVGSTRALAPLRAWYGSHYVVTAWVGGVFDPVRYVLNPARPGYRDVEDVCLGILDRLPRTAHFWDDDAKADYPLRYYYLPVLGLRPDVTLHSIFTPAFDEAAARREAAAIRAVLDARAPAFVSSLAWPEREVLIALALLRRPDADAAALRAMDERAFRSAVPGIGVREIRLTTDPSHAIWQVQERP